MSRLLHALAGQIVAGSIDLTTPDGRRRIHRGGRAGPDVAIVVHDPGLGRRLATGGASALGSSFVEGGWETDDLPGALRVLSASVDQRVRSDLGQRVQALTGRLFGAVTARLGADGAVDTMADHYNLGNDFYTAWLDRTVTYSSALFDPQDLPTVPSSGPLPVSTPPVGRDALAAAQVAKYERILDRAGLGDGDRVLEIGFGWGGFAEVAAARGVLVTGVTIAREQLTFAGKRLADAGLSERVDLHLLDFADIPTTFARGSFDAVVSIEMIESIPQERWAELFAVTAGALRPGGRAVYQVIEIADDLFATYADREDFITTWIFPGGRLPSPAVVRDLASGAGLRERDVHDFGPSYARTLATWWRDFDGAFDDLRPLGFDDRFRRMWHYYLGYCQAGFEIGRIGVAQWTWEQPG
ncbi:SAM-dependent methyltransferase [Salsipaludibacter albus]|uniref:SAM-dependent methyltransferase n=1 Tax=Salsipaludibacter albus TaxID=2849650 RepID=UPI001EE462B7|nr:cyclopropane-fatty-acyl-phospholipid synthase family protein [Salsipaludibacter albus]MBY5162943.1 cyclopropane-fatty-acyl-phospholipid synthase family protein [Salsipaludibacter albus]